MFYNVHKSNEGMNIWRINVNVLYYQNFIYKIVLMSFKFVLNKSVMIEVPINVRISSYV